MSMAYGGYRYEGGYKACLELMAASPRPDAIFCANDLMAIGAMDAVREAGLRVPRDVALMGYDDIEAAGLVTPALSTVVNPADEMGHECARLLLERMSDERGGVRREVVIPHRLVLRASA
jgi:LacI family transcriptional regulator